MATAQSISDHTFDTPTIDSFLEAAQSGASDLSFDAEWSAMTTLAGWSVCAALTVVLILVALWLITRQFTRRITDLRLRVLFIMSWTLSFIVYDVGMCTGQLWSLVTNAPMAILHAFGTFLLDSDISEIHAPFAGSWVFMMLYSLAHACAAMVSMLFVIKHFGFNIIARLRMCAAACFGPAAGNTFVFWGVNEPGCLLAESISRHFASGTGDCRIIMVKTNNGDYDSPENRTGIGRILELLSLRNSEMERLQALGCLTTGTYADMAQVSTMPDTGHDILGKALRLKSLRKIISRYVTGRLHMLFLSDDEAANIQAVSVLLGDGTIRRLATDCSVVFHCHARYNSVHRVIEDQNPLKGIKVVVVDSSHISVEMIKQDAGLQPVNFVDVQPDATVASDFNALVVGFGEVGQDSLRFLYEFGAFAGSGCNDDRVRRSGFSMHVVDRSIDSLAGSFVANAPAIRLSMPFVPGHTDSGAPVTLLKADCRGVEFWLKLQEWIAGLNYVVIATGDDELNISTGVRIFKTALRSGRDMDRLCILVRVRSDDDGHMHRIATHYNRLWAAQTQACDTARLHQQRISSHQPVDMPLRLFGLDKATYTYENIIDETHERRAIEYRERYEASATPGHVYSDCDDSKAWIRDYIDKMQFADPWTGYYPTYSALMALRRAQGQDMANCLHSVTKRQLARTALQKAGMPEFDWSILARDNRTTRYYMPGGGNSPETVSRILGVLAQTEHLRWIASHELLGYRSHGGPDFKDETRMLHGCMTGWENLSETLRSYDCNIVDLSLGIINPERPIKD